MSEYQAVYDAVRSRIRNGDVGAAVQEAIRLANLSHYGHMVQISVQAALAQYERPSAIYRPKLYVDGNAWCALYGNDIISGCAGFGDTPDAAMADFDKHWRNSNPPSRMVKCQVCDEVMLWDSSPDGCRVPNCPMEK